jgi:uncharacterized phage protein gp47/JayE
VPYARPTLTQLRDQGLQDVNAARITDSNGNVLSGVLPKAILRVLTYMEAGMAYELYGYLDWISKQSNPFTATDEWLFAWGALKGVYQKDATAATCPTVTFVGTYSAGNPPTVPAGSTVVRSDGAAYTTNADAAVQPSGIVTVAITASTPGAAGNAAQGTSLTLSTPIAGVNASSGSAVVAITGGADQETQDDFRTRMLKEYAAPPQGGDQSDYEEWALAVPGVTRAWCNPLGAGAGTVVIYTMFDDAESAHGGFPQGTNGVASGETRAAPATGDQLAVANAIFPEQPVTALVYSYAPNQSAVNFTFNNLGGAITSGSALDLDIKKAIDGVFLRQGNPLNGTILPSAFETAIGAIAGMPAFTMSAPSGPVQVGIGNLPVRGTIAYAS